jgi:hypothetical protein
LTLILIMLCSALAGAALTYYLRDFRQPPAMLKGHNPDLNLEVFETGSGLLIHWNSKSAEIQNATRGELSIREFRKEGESTRSLPLKLKDLLQGFLVYQAQGGEVLLNIKVFGQDGAVEQASARYAAGSAPPEHQ